MLIWLGLKNQTAADPDSDLGKQKDQADATPDGQQKQNEEDITANPANPNQSVVESLKSCFKISLEGCKDYLKDEEQKLNDRTGSGDGSTRDTKTLSSLNRPSSISFTTSSLFETFGENLDFPPIIGSEDYNNKEYLGMCKNMKNTPKPSLAESQIISNPEQAVNPQDSQNTNLISGGNVGQSQVINSVPIPPPPGGIPPPPGPPGFIPPPPMLDASKLVNNFETEKKRIEAAGGVYEVKRGSNLKFCLTFQLSQTPRTRMVQPINRS